MFQLEFQDSLTILKIIKDPKKISVSVGYIDHYLPCRKLKVKKLIECID